MPLISGKRDALARILDRSGGASLLLRARRRLRVPVLSVLTYHRVSDCAELEPYDPEVIDATPQQFDAQMRLLARHFNVVGIEDVLAYFRSGRQLPANPCLITFDDGYKDCLNVALPILKKYGLRAVFFIATDFVTERRAYWWDRVHYLVSKSEQETIDLDAPRPLTLDLAGDRKGSLWKILRVIKDEKGLDLEHFLDSLARALKVQWTRAEEEAIADELVMTWDEVRALRAAGMDIQSHTRTHRVLHTLDDAPLSEELAGARRILQREVDQEIAAIAYPVGKRIAEDQRLVGAVEAAGYELGFSNVTGLGRLSPEMNRYDISRLGMDRTLSRHLFRSMMALPWMA
jgi:peptidoglycan/xylan/chitin deacetylase (PgdA/CDA1 family)